MEGKSRTFVRGLVPQRRKSPAVVPTTLPKDAAGETDATESGADWEVTIWEDVRVGDFVKIQDNESIPADILICATSEEENVAFVETKNLDGETK